MKSISQLLDEHGSDKNSQNHYGPLYDVIFDEHRRRCTRTLLEIGIGTLTPGAHSSMYGHDLPGYRPGASLRAWRDAFENAAIYGIDTQWDTMAASESVSHEKNAICTHIVDSTDTSDVIKYMEAVHACGRGQFDVIIDDGSHDPEDQLDTLRNFYPHLASGGIYIIEDVQRNMRTIDQVRAASSTDTFVATFPKADVFVIRRPVT